LGDLQLTLETGVYLSAAIIAILAIVILVRTQRQFTRLREDVAQLSEDVKHLLNAEQRRFLQELKSFKEDRKARSDTGTDL
jgi:Tfp pilus assembly protein PilN